MVTFAKLAVTAAIMAAGTMAVLPSDPPVRHVKFQDRLPQHAVAVAGADICSAQTWPNIAPQCLTAVDGTPPHREFRTVTIEQRPNPASSVLVRMPAAKLASR